MSQPIPRTPWTAEDVKLTFHLYCQLPFGRLHRSNPDIIALAQLMGRSAKIPAMASAFQNPTTVPSTKY